MALDVGQRWVMSLSSLASFMISLDSLVVTTALGAIKRDLGASLEQLEWTVNAYNLTFAMLLLTGAALGDRWGRRRVLAAGLAVFTLASAACALAPDAATLIAARAAQGAGAAFVIPLALTLLSAAFPPERRGKAIGLFSGVTGLATFIGPFLGGAIAAGPSWEWIFWINVPIGLVTIVLVLLRIEENKGPDNRLDVVGLLLVTGGVLGLVLGLVRAPSTGWDDSEALFPMATGVLLLAAFAVWERRATVPMIPLRFFAIRAFTSANLASFALFATLFGMFFFLAQFFQWSQGVGPLEAGLRLLPATGPVMIVAPLAGMLADRIGERVFMVTGLILWAVTLAWLALIAEPALPYLSVLPLLIVGGCGVAMATPAAQKAVVAAVPPHEIGKASGVITTFRYLGGVFGVTVLGTIFATTGGYGSPQTFSDGFAAAMGGGAVIALAGAVAAFGLPGRRSISPPSAQPKAGAKTPVA
ncbi:EmrB/QacA subfamily drug resistance transporter [Nonomuraea fuscirosea]|uniref:EmrB/QacA subfamily drug resistance transporter n=1 Tax=Nonomuraea fuscirosea TaxID=1291556 RepID=A0A2T0LXQ1_9ACTN|nr:MFS transporter [Nonomuraea fuscirosea]PRX48798.1 EmrB/QacA subfamily drug resistance transporter [Nonomuraea fuscirosea]